MTIQTLSGYQGWANYATWNVWLHLNNEPVLYYAMVEYIGTTDAPNYQGLIDYLMINEIMQRETPDGIYWYSPDLDMAELNDAIAETAAEIAHLAS